MNRSRAAAGSIRPYMTVRAATIGSPYRLTFSVATAAPRRASQRGSL